MSKGRTVVVWFRKSLRTHDNAPLVAACEHASQHGTVIPVFILDKWTSRRENVGDVRFEFLMQSLRCLDKNLKSRGLPRGLLFAQGEPEVIMPTLWKAFGVDAITWDDSEENEVHDRQRDMAIAALAAKHGVNPMCGCHSHWLHSPVDYARVLKCKSVPKTYSGFLKIFKTVGSVPAPLPAPAVIPSQLAATDIDNMAKASGIAVRSIPSNLRPPLDIKFPGGEDEGLRRLDAMVTRRPEWAARFEKPKTKPNALQPSTTVLSPYLTHGCVSVRSAYYTVEQAYKKAKGKNSQPPVSLLGQFLWREHWYSVAHFTRADISKMKDNPLSRKIPWDDATTDSDARERLRRWKHAQTGYPFIDAAMIQLRDEGWIHHLARHAVACFLTRGDLWISWEEGFKVFDEFLIDADWSLNACNWMWLSCSAFYHQYFRCYSPVAFGKKTDSRGEYIRKYLPQLKHMPTAYIYEPWKAPRAVQEKIGCIIGKDYPTPIVRDHRVTSKLNMQKMKMAFAANKVSGASTKIKKTKIINKNQNTVKGKRKAKRSQQSILHFTKRTKVTE